MTAEEVRRSFAPEPGLVYLDSATYGLPPDRTNEAVLGALAAGVPAPATGSIGFPYGEGRQVFDEVIERPLLPAWRAQALEIALNPGGPELLLGGGRRPVAGHQTGDAINLARDPFRVWAVSDGEAWTVSYRARPMWEPCWRPPS